MRDYDLLDEPHRRMADDTSRLRDHIRDYAALYATVIKHEMLNDLTAVYGRLALQLDVLHRDYSDDADG